MTYNSNHVNFPTRHLRPRHAEHTLMVECFDALNEWETFDSAELSAYKAYSGEIASENRAWLEYDAIALA